MDKQMSVTVASWAESLVTYFTAVWFFSIVGAKMFVKAALQGKTFPAHCTFIGCIPGMDTDVVIAVAACGETLATDSTVERLCSTMRAKMCVKVAFLGETFTAFCTSIGRRCGMHTHMPSVVAARGETLTTFFATERSFIIMHTKVCVKVAFLGETSTTHFANIEFFSRVYSQMAVKVAASGKTLTTYFTAEPFCSTMREKVSVESAFSGETLPTFCALIRHLPHLEVEWFDYVFFYENCFHTHSFNHGFLVQSIVTTCIPACHRPLDGYVRLWVAPGTFSPPPRVSDPDMHHGTCVTHEPWWMPGSLTSGFLWSRWRGKRSRHSRRMRNSQFMYLVRGSYMRVVPTKWSALGGRGLWSMCSQWGRRVHIWL